MVANGSAFSISMLDPASGMGKYHDENVVVLPFEDFDPQLTTGLIWRSDRAEQQPELQEFLDTAQRLLQVPTL